MKGNNNNLHENNISELKFDKKLADQEWINERDFFRNILFGISATCIPFLTDVNISSYLVTEHGFQNFFINQNRFVSHSLIKNKFFGIDITFENNDDYVEMLEYVKCIDLNDFAKYNGFDINISSLICTGYAYSKLKKSSNSEIKKIIKSADAGSEGLLSLRRREMSKDDLLVAEKIPLADKKEFSKILSSANELPGTEMKCVTQLILKHQDYDPAFFAQGIDNWQLNLNGSKDQVEQWMKDWHRSVFCVNGKISNGSVSELASRYSRDLIFLFFNPEYFFKNEKPGEELIDFYVALNSLLSITEKENAKAILNSDDAKLTDQQKEIKKKLSGHDRNFCKNVINEWKNRFFLDNNPNLTDEFKAKEQKFKEEFNKINLDDLRSKCFVYTKSGKFKEVIDWLIDEIKNDNLDLINKKGNSQQNSLNKNSLTRESLVGALFSGAKIVDKNSEKYLQFDDDKCQEYADKTLDEKIKLIYSEIQFCPEAKKILKPSDFNGTAFCYGNLKSDRLFEFLYEDEFKTKEQKFKEEFNKINLDDLRSKCFVYTKSGEFREVIGWLVDEIKNGHLNLTSERENLHHQLFNKNILTRESLVDKLFSGAKIVDKDNQEYLKFNGDECQKYADKKLDEKIKLIYSEIQFCPEAEKILKPSDFKPTWTNLDKDKYKYGRLKSERLSEFLYFANDEQKYNYIYLRENKNYYRDYILHKDFGENALYNKLYQCTQKADFGKYKREHFIFDETGKIIGMDVLRYFADEISNGNLILKDEDDKDISSQIINRVDDLDKDVFLMKGLLFNEFSVCDKNGKNKIKKDNQDDIGYSDFISQTDECIRMFRLNDDDKKSIEEKKNKQPTHALMRRYALNKIFERKIDPININNEPLINKYVFDFSAAGCDQKDLSFTRDGRVDYIKRDSLPEVLKLGDLKKAELEARLRFCDTKEFKLNFDNKIIEQAKKEYKVDNVTTDNFKDFQKSLSSNYCTNLKDFYNVDSYNDKLVDLYIEFYQKTKIDYEYWCSECAQKFLKDEKGKKEKSEIEIAKIELQFLKREKIKIEDLSQCTKNMYQHEIQEIKSEIELKRFEEGKIKFNDLSQYTLDNRQKEITAIEFKLLKKSELRDDISKDKWENLTLQAQRSKLLRIRFNLVTEISQLQNELEKIDIDGKTIFYSFKDTDNQQLKNKINILIKENVDSYKLQNIPYKLWDSDAKKYYYAKLQMKWFKIGCIPLFIFIGSFFIPGWQIIKIIVMLVSFLCGLCVVKKGIKNKMDYDYTGTDTYDNISNIISNQEDLNSNKGVEVNGININNQTGSTEHENEDENEISTSSNGSEDENTNGMGGNSNNVLMFGNNFIDGIIDENVQPIFENNNQNNQAEVKIQ